MRLCHIAVVGSRYRTDESLVREWICRLNFERHDFGIVAGNNRGPETWAVDAARRLGIPTLIVCPSLEDDMLQWEIAQAILERNRLIANDCDEMFAFVAPDRHGGTEQAIRFAFDLGKLVSIVHPGGHVQLLKPSWRPPIRLNRVRASREMEK